LNGENLSRNQFGRVQIISRSIVFLKEQAKRAHRESLNFAGAAETKQVKLGRKHLIPGK